MGCRVLKPEKPKSKIFAWPRGAIFGGSFNFSGGLSVKRGKRQSCHSLGRPRVWNCLDLRSPCNGYCFPGFAPPGSAAEAGGPSLRWHRQLPALVNGEAPCPGGINWCLLIYHEPLPRIWLSIKRLSRLICHLVPMPAFLPTAPLTSQELLNPIITRFALVAKSRAHRPKKVSLLLGD